MNERIEVWALILEPSGIEAYFFFQGHVETSFLVCNGDAVGKLEVKMKLFGMPPITTSCHPAAQDMRILDELASQCTVPVVFSSSATPGTEAQCNQSQLEPLRG